MKPDELTPRQGKTLRYIADRTKSGNAPVPPEDCVVSIKWSDLPKSVMQATTTCSALVKLGLLVHVQYGYKATTRGVKLSSTADKRRLWMSTPPPRVTNPRPKTTRRRKK